MLRRTGLFMIASIVLGLATADARLPAAGAGKGYVRGVHFGAYWPEFKIKWPGRATVKVWKDDSTPPTAKDIIDWAVRSNATHLVFTPYYGTLYSKIGGTTEAGDRYIDELANGLKEHDMTLVLMIMCDQVNRRYPDLGGRNKCAAHVAKLAKEYPNIILNFDEPCWGGGRPLSESNFAGMVKAARDANPDVTIMVGLDYPRGSTSAFRKYWKYCDGVMLIDYWARSAATLGSRIQQWVKAVHPKPVWVWMTTGDINLGGSYLLSVGPTMEYLEQCIQNAGGSFIFDGAGAWLYAGDKNPHDKGQRQIRLTKRYGQMVERKKKKDRKSGRSGDPGAKLMEQAKLWESGRNFNRAVDLYRQVVAMGEKTGYAEEARERLDEILSDPETAEAYEAYRKERDLDEMLEKARSHHRAGRTGEALRCCDELLRKSPDGRQAREARELKRRIEREPKEGKRP
ncbi:MAG: tetratricopeptide repeat protein [Planctomycetota bacterium]|jgi:hypothetical protein